MRDLSVRAEAFTERVSQRDDHERQTHDRQDRVRREQREVNGPDPARPPETNNSRVKVEVEIEAQKNCGAQERRNHAQPVERDLARLDEVEAEREQYSARAVQRC